MSGERSIAAMLMEDIPRCPCSWYVIQLHDRIVYVLKEFMLEAGATKGRDLRLEVHRIRSEASRDRLGRWFGLISLLHTVILLLMWRLQVLVRTPMFIV
jgi:hypothetical protein